jgi:hypothetical protein
MPHGSAWACLQPRGVRGKDDRSRRRSPLPGRGKSPIAILGRTPCLWCGRLGCRVCAAAIPAAHAAGTPAPQIRPVDRVHEPHSAAIFGQKRPPGKARERQRMGMSRFVDSSTRFPNVRSWPGRLVIMAESFAVNTSCRSLADMPTQSRGNGTRRARRKAGFSCALLQ